MNKICNSLQEAVQDIHDGATILISGFGGAGNPTELNHALLDQGARELTVISNNAGNFETGLASLLKAGRVRKMVCSFPRASDSYVFDELYRLGKIELECVPQGTLAERIRAGGSGLSAFFTPTGAGTELSRGKEERIINGRLNVLEYALRGDFALISAGRGDRWGNLTYRKAARNFGPIMCMAATTAVVQVREIVELGALDPEHIVTPGVFVQRVVQVSNPEYSF